MPPLETTRRFVRTATPFTLIVWLIVAEQVIAKGGDTGSLEGPRLYFEVWRNGKPEDPLVWLARH